MAYFITGPEKLKKIQGFFKKNRFNPGTVLDIGGTTDSYLFLHRLFPKATILTLNNYPGHLKGTQNPVLFDAEKGSLELGDHSVSCILLLDIIEHLVDPTHCLQEAVRVLQKNGLLIITTPNLAMLYNRLFLLLGWSFSNYHTSAYKVGNPLLKIRNPGTLWNENAHKSVFTFFELKELVEKIYGLEILRLEGFSYQNPKATGSDSTYGTVRRIIGKILPNQLREGILLIAKKPVSTPQTRKKKKIVLLSPIAQNEPVFQKSPVLSK